MEREVFICECNSLEHQIIFWYDEEDNMLYCEPHLTTHRNFIKRLWYGLKYAFGYKSRFGDWDSSIFKPEDLDRLRNCLDKINTDCSFSHKSVESCGDFHSTDWNGKCFKCGEQVFVRDNQSK